ncbi:lipase-like PAD4 [Cryptomeria japonica]|uniref:lipase-like PAD4 n=1 Tax=Cryptomeria japonica TaxID=3369 RepID=UPI0025AD8499|nr:lipase-like PAD4 [Cryptomeria japonica]
MASLIARLGGPEIIRRASYAAYNSANGYVSQDFGNNTVCVAFSGSQDPNTIGQIDNKFGVGKINENNDCFESMVDGTTRKDRDRATVYRAALIKFLGLWNDIKTQVGEALQTGKTVVFTGHSIGGGIATLATLASLEKCGKGASVYAITFGFPLIGDEILARAVRRQGWANHFYNVVSKNDVFARTLLAPCISVSGFVAALLPYWKKCVDHMNGVDSDTPMGPDGLEFNKYLVTVLHHACAVVNLITVNNMEPGNKLIASLKPAVKLSPYRPFGYYLFCSEEGGLFVENNEAVLPILFYSLTSAQGEASISDHTGYDTVFNAHTNVVNLEGLQNLPLSQGAAQSSAMEIQLNALGIGIQNTRARLALRAAGEAEHKLEDNRNKLKDELAKLLAEGRGKDAGHMVQVRDYRKKCLSKNVIGYYDAFREQKEKEDFQANLNRLNLAAFYDKLEDMAETHQVPDDFQFIEDLIKEGTEYRLLVEPLDIANYYRLGKHEDSGHYIRNARPRRYKALEKWLADIKSDEKKRDVISSLQVITKDSLFWAHVEEVSWIMSNPRENLEVKRTRCTELQNYVKQLLERQELCKEEVVMGESSFVKWWKKLSPQDQQASPISSIFQG